MPRGDADSTPTADTFAAGGEMGRLMAAHDWAATPVGPVEGWPQTLRSAVGILLRSRYPMLVTWGPEYTQLYNDAYAEVIGDKHPAALGGDVRVTLAENWDVLGPIVDGAVATGVPSWIPALQLLLERAGYREEAYFSVSHARAVDDEGRIAGMFCVCSEVTEQVIGERRLRLLRDLPSRAGDARTVQESVSGLLDALAEHPLDVPFAALYLRDDVGLRRAGAFGLGGPDDALPTELALTGAPDPWGLGSAAEGVSVVLDRVQERLRATGGPWGDAVTRALSLPLGAAGDAPPLGVLLAGVSPNRGLDERHRDFFSLLASQISVAVRSARAYEDERRRVEAMRALDRAKSDFFANVSHEFRTPLTLLLGPLEDALADPEEPLAPAQRDRVDLAARNARRMLKLVNNLLDFSRLESGTAQPDLRRLDLAAFTSEVASVFRSGVERAGMRLVVDCPPLSDEVAVDPDGWEQVVLNLVSNAFKYTFTGEIRVSLREEGEDVVLEVADTGIGIAPEELEHLFERFHRVKDSRARTHEGTGVGLALVRDVATTHGGHASARSEVGRGSTFTVAVPARRLAAQAGVRPREDAAALSPRAALTEEEVASWTPPPAAPAVPGVAGRARILVADDNADMRGYLEHILRPHYDVRSVPDGQAALEAVRADPPDLLLTDVMMPRLDGFALLAAIRRDPALASTPVVILSARSGTEATVEGLERGADDHLAKPFRGRELLARVQANLNRGKREGPAPERLPAPTLRRAAPAPRPPRGAPALDEEPVAVREGGELRLRLPASPRVLGWMRRELRVYLADTGASRDEADGLVLAACEAATNSIEHALDPTEAVIDVTARLEDGRVRIDLRDQGQWNPRGPSMDRGRGSMLMEAVADVQIVPSPAGTLVSLTSKTPVAR